MSGVEGHSCKMVSKLGSGSFKHISWEGRGNYRPEGPRISSSPNTLLSVCHLLDFERVRGVQGWVTSWRVCCSRGVRVL